MDTATLLRTRFPARTEAKRDISRESLAAILGDDPDRLAHCLEVAELAKEIGAALLGFADAEQLKIAGLWHDAAYSAKLRITGFHPLDAAIYLAHAGADVRVVDAVLQHGAASVFASETPGLRVLYEELSKVTAAREFIEVLNVCDMRVGPAGERMTIRERTADVQRRYGTENVIHKFWRQQEPFVLAEEGHLLSRLSEKAPHFLPWVFVDVDSTLVPVGGSLSRRSRSAIESYLAAGGHFSLASGKHPSGLQDLLREIGLPGWHVALNGSALVSQESTEFVGGLVEGGSLLDALRRSSLRYAVFDTRAVYLESPRVSAADIHELELVREPAPLRSKAPDGPEICKVLFFCRKDETEASAEIFQLAAAHGCVTLRTSPVFLEICSPNINKGTGMRRLCQESGWPEFYSTAVGDSENDMGMLRRAGRPLAVGNAAQVILDAADWVLPKCDADGVAFLLEEELRKFSGEVRDE